MSLVVNWICGGIFVCLLDWIRRPSFPSPRLQRPLLTQRLGSITSVVNKLKVHTKRYLWGGGHKPYPQANVMTLLCEVFLYLYYFLHCRIIVKTSKL
uniref:Uncharacterized protein n=1 Tax=Salmo trutta TaxID=8032 RepID=A0A674EGJ4_SALTR